MTSKAIFYYSITGNTKAIVEESNTYDFEIFNLHSIEPDDVDFNKYDTILIGTSTIGDGIPHDIFKDLSHKLSSLGGKKIGLFGSGNSIYRYYCGALDLLEGLLSTRNQILFKFKFESYPADEAKQQFQKLIEEVKCI